MNLTRRLSLLFLVLICASGNLSASTCEQGDLDLGDGVCIHESELCYLDKKVEDCDDGDAQTIDSCAPVGIPGTEIFGSCLHEPVETNSVSVRSNEMTEVDFAQEVATVAGCQNYASDTMLAGLFTLFLLRRSKKS